MRVHHGRVLPVLAAVFACFLLTSAVRADEHPNFSGEWKMDISKSNFGPIPPPDSARYTIRHSGADLSLDYMQNGTVDAKNHVDITTDGQERVTESKTDTEIWTRAYWAGPTLILESRDKARPAHESRGIKWTSRWTLSDDGKTLAIQKHFTTPQGEFDQTLIFERQ